MQLTALLVPCIIFASFTHALTFLRSVPDRRSDECMTDKPGCVSVWIMKPGTPGSPTYPDGPKTEDRYRSDSGCITKATLLGGHPTNSHITAIEPDQGGHCLIYHSKECRVDTGMPLDNPQHLDLKFPK